MATAKITKTSAKSTKTTAKTPKKNQSDNGVKKILFVASESTPFIATGGLAEVIGSLTKALADTKKFDVRVVLPLYSDIKKEYRDKFAYLGNIYVHLAWRNQYCGIFSCVKDGVTFYFIDNEYYFKRPGCYGYFDDGERFAFFSRSVLEIMPFLDFYPDVMHCHDWQAALSAIYLKTNYCFRPEYQYIRALFTIHNIEYQGQYSMDLLCDLFDIFGEYRYLVEYRNSINLMKGAIECCERFSTVSPRYAQEIKQAYFAHGLDDIVRKNEFKLMGILNGIDFPIKKSVKKNYKRCCLCHRSQTFPLFQWSAVWFLIRGLILLRLSLKNFCRMMSRSLYLVRAMRITKVISVTLHKNIRISSSQI